VRVRNSLFDDSSDAFAELVHVS